MQDKNLKMVVILGALLGLAALIFLRPASGGSTSSSDSSSGSGSLLFVPATENTYDFGTGNNFAEQGSVTNTFPTSTPPVPATVGASPAPTSTAPSSAQAPAAATSTPPASIAYLPPSTPSSVVTTAESLPNTNVVQIPNAGHVVATGGSSYQNAVNAAAGQWLKAVNGQSYFYPGHYDAQGDFVVTTTKLPAPSPNGPHQVIQTSTGYMITPQPSNGKIMKKS